MYVIGLRTRIDIYGVRIFEQRLHRGVTLVYKRIHIRKRSGRAGSKRNVVTRKIDRDDLHINRRDPPFLLRIADVERKLEHILFRRLTRLPIVDNMLVTALDHKIGNRPDLDAIMRKRVELIDRDDTLFISTVKHPAGIERIDATGGFLHLRAELFLGRKAVIVMLEKV